MLYGLTGKITTYGKLVLHNINPQKNFIKLK